MKKVKIGKKVVGEGEPCFIIAEAGVNHNGDIELAKKLIDAAKDAGADAVKFQTFKAENVVSNAAKMADYQEKNIGSNESQLEMIKGLELNYNSFKELKEYCDDMGITFLSTPHTFDAVDFLDDLVPAYKIGSGDLTNLPLLKKIVGKGKPIVLSTGMATLGEIEDALNNIKEKGFEDIILLHCVSNYPAKEEEVNLRVIRTLRCSFGVPVGFSDHTLSIFVPIGAVTLDASIIEKHFTLDRNLSGPDHKASLEPKELKEMVKAIRSVESALGNGIKKPTKGEQLIKEVVRKSIVARVNIPENSTITEDTVTIKRPGTGLPPKYLKKIIGRRAKKNIKENDMIDWKMIE